MMYLERNQLVRLENQLFTLSRRLETFVRVGVAIPKTEREALTRILTALHTEINDLENKDSKWKAEHAPRTAQP
jgi:hypothetical protein